MLILSAGCAALSSVTAQKESLEERVQNYMQAQIEKKWDRAYTFFGSSARARITRESYVNRPRRAPYKGFVIDEIKVLPSGNQATVKVRIDVSYRGYNFEAMSQMQDWVKERGEWFVEPEPPSQKNPFNIIEEKQK
jgi:hypothetical protein